MTVDTRPAPGWQLRHLMLAPHRLLFAAAATLWGLAAADWALALSAQVVGRPRPWVVAPAQAHALVMTLGIMPLFFAGFLLTALPRWLPCPPVICDGLAGPTLGVLGGWMLVMPALHGHRGAAALGLGAVALGLGALLTRLLRLWRQGEPGRRLPAGLAIAGFALCAAAAAAAGVAVAHPMGGPALGGLLAGVALCWAAQAAAWTGHHGRWLGQAPARTGRAAPPSGA